MKSKFALGGTKSLNVWRNKFSDSPYTATSYSPGSQLESLGVWRAKFDEPRTSEGYADIADRSRDWLSAGARARGVLQNRFVRRGNLNGQYRQYPNF